MIFRHETIQLYLSNAVLDKFINTNIFQNLKEPTHDQAFMENHVVHVKDSNVSPPDPYSYGTACRYTTSEWGPNRRVV